MQPVNAPHQIVDRPPAIAVIAGITVGKTAIQGFEKLHGKGRVMTGGHPNGARQWYEETAGVLIDADGFNYAPDGEVIDTLVVTWQPANEVDRRVPRIKLRPADLGLLTRLKKGMVEAQIEQSLGTKLKSGSAVGTGLIRFGHQLGNKENDRFTKWEAVFTAGKSGLESIRIVGD